MIRNLDMTRRRFVALLTMLILMSLISLGWSGLLQSSELILFIAIIITYAGIIPFFLGVAVQAVFRKKTIPAYAAWVFAFILVAAQWIITRKTTIRSLEQDMMSLVLYFLIIGVFVNTGTKSCRAFMEVRKEKQQGKQNSANDDNA